MISLAGFCGALLMAFVVAGTINQIALRPWRRSSGAHWTERARLLFPARVSCIQLVWFLPGIAVLSALNVTPNASPLAVGGGSFVGALLGSYPLEKAVYARWTVRDWVKRLGITSLSGASTIVGVVAGIVLMPVPLDISALWVIAGLFFFVVPFQADVGFRILRGLGAVRQVEAHVQKLVDEVVVRAGVRVRSVWTVDTPIANALALPVQRDLVFTSRFLEIVSAEELQAICAHELGHLAEPRWMIAIRVLQRSVSLVPFLFLRPGFAEVGFLSLVFAFLAWAVMHRGFLRLSVVMERRADKMAAIHAADPVHYAQGLERLYKTNMIPAVLPEGSARTHPDLYDRIEAAGVTPEYPRPAAPVRYNWASILLMVALCAGVAIEIMVGMR